MNLRFLRKGDIALLNDFLSNEIGYSEVSEFQSQLMGYDVMRQLRESDAVYLRNLSASQERFVFLELLLALPEVPRYQSSVVNVYFNGDICPWTTMPFAKFLLPATSSASTPFLNDPKETIWFSDFISKLGSPIIKSNVFRIVSTNDVFAKYTTLSEENRHYMISNYAYNSRNWVEYQKTDVDIKFKEKNKDLGRIGLQGYVRYGEVKAGFMLIYNELKRIFPKSRALNQMLVLMCFFVKGKRMQSEREYRYLSIGKGHKAPIPNFVLNTPPSHKIVDPSQLLTLKYNSYYTIPSDFVFGIADGGDISNWPTIVSAMNKMCE